MTNITNNVERFYNQKRRHERLEGISGRVQTEETVSLVMSTKSGEFQQPDGVEFHLRNSGTLFDNWAHHSSTQSGPGQNELARDGEPGAFLATLLPRLSFGLLFTTHTHGEIRMRVWHLILLFLFGVTGSVVGIHYAIHGFLHGVHIAMSFFMVLNLLICVWEWALFFRIDKTKRESEGYLREFDDRKSRPAINFMNEKAALPGIFRLSFWSRVWSSYAMFDGSYADKRTFGWAIDVGNGISTFIPSLVVLLGMTFHFLSARILGIVGLILCYQMTYGTVIYWLSFVAAERYKRLRLGEKMMFIVGTNAPWFSFGVLGIYVSIRFIVEDSFRVIGFVSG